MNMEKYVTLNQVLISLHIINGTLDILVIVIILIFIEKQGKTLHNIIEDQIHVNAS